MEKWNLYDLGLYTDLPEGWSPGYSFNPQDYPPSVREMLSVPADFPALPNTIAVREPVEGTPPGLPNPTIRFQIPNKVHYQDRVEDVPPTARLLEQLPGEDHLIGEASIGAANGTFIEAQSNPEDLRSWDLRSWAFLYTPVLGNGDLVGVILQGPGDFGNWDSSEVWETLLNEARLMIRRLRTMEMIPPTISGTATATSHQEGTVLRINIPHQWRGMDTKGLPIILPGLYFWSDAPPVGLLLNTQKGFTEEFIQAAIANGTYPKILGSGVEDHEQRDIRGGKAYWYCGTYRSPAAPMAGRVNGMLMRFERLVVPLDEERTAFVGVVAPDRIWTAISDLAAAILATAEIR